MSRFEPAPSTGPERLTFGASPVERLRWDPLASALLAR